MEATGTGRRFLPGKRELMAVPPGPPVRRVPLTDPAPPYAWSMPNFRVRTDRAEYMTKDVLFPPITSRHGGRRARPRVR